MIKGVKKKERKRKKNEWHKQTDQMRPQKTHARIQNRRQQCALNDLGKIRFDHSSLVLVAFFPKLIVFVLRRAW